MKLTEERITEFITTLQMDGELDAITTYENTRGEKTDEDITLETGLSRDLWEALIYKIQLEKEIEENGILIYYYFDIDAYHDLLKRMGVSEYSTKLVNLEKTLAIQKIYLEDSIEQLTCSN